MPPERQGQLPHTTAPPDPPSTLFSCLWESADPASAIRTLAAGALETEPISFDAIEAVCRLRDPDLLERAWQRLSRCTPGPWQWYYRTWLWLCAGRRWDWEPSSDPQAWAIVPLLPPEGLRRLRAAAAEGSLSLPHDQQQELQTCLAASEKPAPISLTLAENFYARLGPSLRRPWHNWESPEAASPEALEGLVATLRDAQAMQQPFSLIRLGDGEGLFLCGERHDLGGAIANGTHIDPQLHALGNRLDPTSYEQLLEHFRQAIAGSDLIAIPDLEQCHHGPEFMHTVAAGLQRHFPGAALENLRPRLLNGGWHLHNFLLQHNAYRHGPFLAVAAVIAPSLPPSLAHLAASSFLIPGELNRRADAYGSDAHYPVIYGQVLAWIEASIRPGMLVLVAAGILGKIYCHAIREQGGIALDVGSVLDLCAGHGHTRGEYRLNPWLKARAEQAFTPLFTPVLAS
ncbi:MAG: hypothetical protein N3Z29_00240 [Synechococcaceae cyanobacterium MAG-AL1]|nr:hypothetical protein [Candidatus Regnicoccus frigidus MAG-AL1]